MLSQFNETTNHNQNMSRCGNNSNNKEIRAEAFYNFYKQRGTTNKGMHKDPQDALQYQFKFSHYLYNYYPSLFINEWKNKNKTNANTVAVVARAVALVEPLHNTDATTTTVVNADHQATQSSHNQSKINTTPVIMKAFLILIIITTGLITFDIMSDATKIMDISFSSTSTATTITTTTTTATSKSSFISSPKFVSQFISNMFQSSNSSSMIPVSVSVEHVHVHEHEHEHDVDTKSSASITECKNDDNDQGISTITFETAPNTNSNHNSNCNNRNYLYLNEIDYNLLLNVTTAIGTYQPLPSSPLPYTKNYHQTTRRMIKPKQFIPVLEARGTDDRDIDKDEYGHRRDTIPIANSIDQYVHDDNTYDDNVKSAVFQFLEEEDGRNQYAVESNRALKHYLKEVAHGIVVRVNPGTLSPLSQKKCDDMLRELNKDGVVMLSHPDVMSTLGAKDSLVKIKNLKCGLEDTEVYYDEKSFQQGFLKSIAFQPRVVKQNRGSQGEGVWIVKLKNEDAYCDTYGECTASLDTELVLMEAFDNHVEYHTVREFIDFCTHGRTGDNTTEWTTTSGGKYFEGGLAAGAMVVDQRFLPRIVEGEVRCLMVGSELVEIVHKKPKDGGLSATLQSGATYTKYAPDDVKFAKLIKNFKEDIPRIMESFGMSDQPLPLLWTVDYIYGDSDDELYAGEINCSCPGITQQLHITPTVAKVAFKSVFVDR